MVNCGDQGTSSKPGNCFDFVHVGRRRLLLHSTRDDHNPPPSFYCDLVQSCNYPFLIALPNVQDVVSAEAFFISASLESFS